MTCSCRIKEAGSFKTKPHVVSLHLASNSILGLKWSVALPKLIDICRATGSRREGSVKVMGKPPTITPPNSQRQRFSPKTTMRDRSPRQRSFASLLLLHAWSLNIMASRSCVPGAQEGLARDRN